MEKLELRQINQNKAAENLRTRSFLICNPHKRVTDDQNKADEMAEEFRTQRREERSIRNFRPKI